MYTGSWLQCVPKSLFEFIANSDKLRGNLLLKHYQLEVDLRHISLYNDEIAHAIQDRPADVLPLVSWSNISIFAAINHREIEVRKRCNESISNYPLPTSRRLGRARGSRLANNTQDTDLHQVWLEPITVPWTYCKHHQQASPNTGHRHLCICPFISCNQAASPMSCLPITQGDLSC